MNTKQVIVIRKDLNMRKGKMCAQASHASMAFLTQKVDLEGTFHGIAGFTEEEIQWLKNSFTKIAVSVGSEEELIAVHEKALEAGLTSHLVTDNGTTEFGGVKTRTCIAIGPHEESKFIGITDHLPLL